VNLKSRPQSGTARSRRVFGVTGWKNSGKTGLTVRIVEELTRRGWHVSTIKHAHHDFDIDRENTDSWRHRHAGASEVAIVSGRRWALMHELRGEAEPSMDDVLARLAPCDLVIIEGYKRETHPKMEARRLDASNRAPLAADDPAIVAIAADHQVAETHLPVFDLDDTAAIADFVERVTGLVSRESAAG
jgi:molybdopterin-guanine dinucleotide biosynthesis adapter protein